MVHLLHRLYGVDAPGFRDACSVLIYPHLLCTSLSSTFPRLGGGFYLYRKNTEIVFITTFTGRPEQA